MQHLPPHLQRRSFLKLGISAAVATGAVALIKPGLVKRLGAKEVALA